VLPTKDVEMCSIREGSACDQVQDFMTPIERAVILTPDMPMRVAAELLSKNGITGAPVAIGGKLVGVLTQFDFL
jgi:CBS domain-containing protein